MDADADADADADPNIESLERLYGGWLVIG